MTPDDVLAAVERLPPERRAEFQAHVEAVYGGERPDQLLARIWPREPPPRHLRVICRIFDEARRQRKHVCLSMPPRHGKTFTILRCLAWWLKRHPADVCAYTTYNDHKAWSKSRRCRQFAREAGVQLDAGGTNAEWRTKAGGGLLAAGAGGSLTGEGVSGVMVVDDPYSNRVQADSETWRERVWDWFNEVVFTRMMHGSVIVVHTRWHDDDLIGKLEKMDGWEVINLAAIANDNDILDRENGEALWPEKYPVHELEAIRAQIGEWSFAALYQGRPRPKGAEIFHEPVWYDPTTFKLDGWWVFIGADPAASEKKRADHSAAVALAIKGANENRTARVLEELHGQWTMPEFARRLRAFQAHWYGAGIAVESVGGFKAVPQILRELDPSLRIVEVHPTLDKFQRAQPVAAAWNGGRVLLPAGRPWTGPYVHEVKRFTGADGGVDDRVDALAHAWNVGLEHGVIERGSVAQPSRWR